MRVDRYTLLHGLLAAAIRERERRQTGEKARDYREELIADLDQMAERARAAPGWCEPTAEERRENLAYLEAWFREHGYPQVASACAELRKKAH